MRDYFDFIADRLFNSEPRPLSVDNVVEWTPVDVSAMQGLVVGLPSVEEQRMLRALFGPK